MPNNPLAAPVSTRLVNQITNRMAKLRPGGNYLKTRGLLGKLAVPLITSSGRDKSGPAATVANNPYNPPVSPELTAKLNRLFGRQRPGKPADVKTAADRISGSSPAPLDEDGNRSPFSALKALPLAGSWISDAEKFPGRLPGGGGRSGAALPSADSSAVNPLLRPGDKAAPREPGKVPAPKMFTRLAETMNRTGDQFKNMAVQATGDPDILKKPEKMQELVNGLGQSGTPEGQAALLRNSSFGKEMETLGETWTGDKNFLFSEENRKSLKDPVKLFGTVLNAKLGPWASNIWNFFAPLGVRGFQMFKDILQAILGGGLSSLFGQGNQTVTGTAPWNKALYDPQLPQTAYKYPGWQMSPWSTGAWNSTNPRV